LSSKPLDLGDRLLWPDGVSTVTPEKLSDYIVKVGASKLAVTELTPEIEQFNQTSDAQIGVKTDVDPTLFPPAWTLPERYKYLDLESYLVGLADKIERDELYEKRLQRLSEEIELFDKLGLDQVLRALIYVLDMLREKGQVWGVGRGSSCSSYLLYLIGLHDVDPVKYGIEVTDFLRE